MTKPLFVALEEAVAQAYSQVRETADAMRAENNALRAIPALELAGREIALVFAMHYKLFAHAQHAEFDSLAARITLAIQRQIDTTQNIEERWLVSVDAIWSLDQVHPNLVAAFNEFRPRMM